MVVKLWWKIIPVVVEEGVDADWNIVKKIVPDLRVSEIPALQIKNAGELTFILWGKGKKDSTPDDTQQAA